MKNLKFILVMGFAFQNSSIISSANSAKFEFGDIFLENDEKYRLHTTLSLSNLKMALQVSHLGHEQEIAMKMIDAMLERGFDINTVTDFESEPTTILDMVSSPYIYPNKVLADYIIKKGGKRTDVPDSVRKNRAQASKASIRNKVNERLENITNTAKPQNIPEPKKNPPACCNQKADGQTCEYSDECRGSCKCKYPTIAKKCAFGAGGVCQNQTKYCDVSKCVIK